MTNPNADMERNLRSIDNDLLTTAKPAITVVSNIDNNYVMPLTVTLRSAAENLSDTHRLHAVILEQGVSDESKCRLEASVAEFDVSISWRPVQLPARQFTLGSHPGGVAATYFKLFIGEQFTDDTSRVIYLDADVVVCKDLLQLWLTPLDGMMLGAVADSQWQCERMKRLKLPDAVSYGPGAYFNAGVMLIDLTIWRAANVYERAIHFAQLYRDLLYIVDQDLLNCVVAGKFKLLAPSWNLLEFYGTAYRRYWDKISPYPTTALNAANQSPAIVHYSGFPKPWQGPYAAHDPALFLTYYSRTQWHERLHTQPGPMSSENNRVYRETVAILKVFYRELELGRVRMSVLGDLVVHLVKNMSAFVFLPGILCRNGYWAARAYMVPRLFAHPLRFWNHSD